CLREECVGFRFRRTLGIIPGVRLNLGMKSGSVSFGTRGFHYTVGTRGERVTVGLPGSGLFWTKKINRSAAQQPRRSIPGPPPSPMLPQNAARANPAGTPTF